MPWRGPAVKGEFPTLGHLAVDWIEATLPIPDGPKKGQPFRLYDEQVRHLLWKYRLNPNAVEDDGNDAFTYSGSMLVRGQKWGKDPLLAAVNLFHAFGPCEFAGWDANGEPVGQPAPTPWVAIAALNDEQTDNTWLPLLEMARNSEIADLFGVEINDTFIKLPSGNPMEYLTTTAWGRLGGRFTHVSITESGLLIGEGQRGGLTFVRTLKRNVGGMNGMWTSATNTWDPTEGSDAQKTYEAKDPHVFVDARLARVHVDLDDDVALKREIIYVYGDSIRSAGGHVSEQRLIRDCRNKQMGESEVRRFYLSEIIAGTKNAVDPAKWDALTRSDDPLVADEPVTLGFDGSRSRDATAIVVCRIRDGRLFRGKVWVPADFPDHRVPRLDVNDIVDAMFEAYDVRYMYADPYRWQDYLDVWAARYSGRVVEFPTNVERRMDAAIERFQTAYRDGTLTHDGDTTLADHAKATALVKGKRKPPREDEEANRVEHYLSLTKKGDGLIDAFVAAHLAYEARGQAIEDGALEPDDTTEVWGFWE